MVRREVGSGVTVWGKGDYRYRPLARKFLGNGGCFGPPAVFIFLEKAKSAKKKNGEAMGMVAFFFFDSLSPCPPLANPKRRRTFSPPAGSPRQSVQNTISQS